MIKEWENANDDRVEEGGVELELVGLRFPGRKMAPARTSGRLWRVFCTFPNSRTGIRNVSKKGSKPFGKSAHTQEAFLGVDRLSFFCSTLCDAAACHGEKKSVLGNRRSVTLSASRMDGTVSARVSISAPRCTMRLGHFAQGGCPRA